MERAVRFTLQQRRLAQAKAALAPLLVLLLAVMPAFAPAGELPATPDGPIPLTLAEALSAALERNPALAAEAAQTRESAADYRAARAPLLPSVTVTAYDSRLNEDRLGPGVSMPGAALYTRERFAGVTARQLLFDGGRGSGARDAAARALDAQREALAAAREETVLAVTQAFARSLAAASLTRVAKDSMRRQSAFETMTADFFRAGKATRLDALKAEAARQDAEKSLTAAREAEALAAAQLAQVIGLDGVARVAARGELARDLADAPATDTAVALALAQNPDVKRAGHQIDQAEENVAAARGAYLPELALQGAYGYRERDIGGGADEWLIGVTAGWSLYRGGATAAQVAKARERLTQAREQQRALVLEITAQVHSALAAWRTSQSNARATAQLVATGREALAAAEALYRAGKATALDVLTAQTDLARAEGAYVNALADYAGARARLARLTGNSQTEMQNP